MPLNEEEVKDLEYFQSFQLENILRISDEDEPGQQLWLCLTFISKESKEPLANQNIHFYHTSSEGEYQPSNPNDETTARLNGAVLTNNLGQTFIQTILPGDYGSSSDNRHIHTNVEGARPEAYDIHFKQYSGFMSKNFISGSDQHFLADLKQTEDGVLVAFLNIEVKNITVQSAAVQQNLPDCEWCGASEASKDISWETFIADETVEGERLILEGTIYEFDGTTRAKDVVIYAYHTNIEGVYEKKGNEIGNGLRHGFLRGWVKTNEAGQYRFHTIKPAPYPSHKEPAHIHMTLMREDFEEYWVNSTWFKGDQIITDELTKNLNRKGGFSNVIELKKNEENVWVGKRDIILQLPQEE